MKLRVWLHIVQKKNWHLQLKLKIKFCIFS
jgi:hypothetical protein